MKVLLLISLISVVLIKLCYGASDNKIVRARLESCPGCQLNRLTEVRNFAYDDIPKYENVEFKKIGGAPPELVFLDDNDQEIERHPLRDLSRKQCNDLLQERGFKPTADKEL